MLKKWLPNWLNGLIVGCVIFSNVIIFGTLVLMLGLIKLVLRQSVWLVAGLRQHKSKHKRRCKFKKLVLTNL